MDEVYICELCQRAYEPKKVSGARELKKFKGYFVDLRLQQFRKLNGKTFGTTLLEFIEFIEFHSPKGKKLLSQMHEEVTR